MNGNMSYVDLQSALYGSPSADKVRFLSQKMESYQNDMGQYRPVHYENSVRVFNQYNSDGAIRRSDIVSKHARKLNVDDIRMVDTHNINRVGHMMQDAIMSDPYVRGKRRSQVIDGYSDSYFDENPIYESNRRFTYLHATSGIVNSRSNNLDHHYTRHQTMYTPLDKVTIKASWDTAMSMIMSGNDPTLQPLNEDGMKRTQRG